MDMKLLDVSYVQSLTNRYIYESINFSIKTLTINGDLKRRRRMRELRANEISIRSDISTF